ncbi:4226_t:CDS:2 [Entrophospora sp. SA101]|nr:4226_t:CDS:2 [Entrophospora sp. SA101]CAJ0825417.1 627_t:CDS:2 [Entrophospora sp. SA101]
MTEKNIPTSGKKKLAIDREKTAPFLLRIFCKPSYHHRIDDYTPEHLPIDDEVQIYTWKDATLKEIANLIKEVNKDAKRPKARLSFKLVYIDNLRGRYIFKELGVVSNSASSIDDDKNLDDARFVIGDFLDVAIFYGAPPPGRIIERRGENLRDRNIRDFENRDRVGGGGLGVGAGAGGVAGGGGGRNLHTGVGKNNNNIRDYRDRERNQDIERDRDHGRNALRDDRRGDDRRDDRRDGSPNLVTNILSIKLLANLLLDLDVSSSASTLSSTLLIIERSDSGGKGIGSLFLVPICVDDGKKIGVVITLTAAAQFSKTQL